MQMTNNNTKGCSASLVIRETQIRTTVGCTHQDGYDYWKKKKGNSVKEYVEKLKSHKLVVGIYNGAAAMKNSSSKVKQSDHMT